MFIVYVSNYLVGLHVSKLRFFLLILFKRFFLLTQAEKRAFSQLNAVISAEVSKKKRFKRTSKKNRNLEACKPANYVSSEITKVILKKQGF